MILRCTAPRKRDRLAPCGQFVGVVADGSIVLGRIWHSGERKSPLHHVMRCGCGALWEVAPENLASAA